MLAALLLVATVTAPEDLRLIGVVSSASPEHSVAVLESAGRTSIASVGDTAFGGTLLSIESGRVLIDYAGEPVELRLVGEVADAAPVPAPVAHPPAPPPPPAPEAPPGPQLVTLEREEVQRRLAAEMSRILSETQLVPVREGLEIVGFSIARLPGGTLLGEAGLEAGDVLTEIDGVPLDSMATLIGLWPKLQNAKRVRAVVLRDGRPLTLGVDLR